MVYSGDKKHDITMNFKSKVNDRLTVSARANFDVRKIWVRVHLATVPETIAIRSTR